MTDGVSVQRLLRERVAEEVRALLARRMMTGADLAAAIGRSPMYVSRRVRGEVAFDLDDMERLAGVFGVEVADLLPRSAGSSQVAGRGSARSALNDSSTHVAASAAATDPNGPRPSVRATRHVAASGSPYGGGRRDAARPVSAVPFSKRRPAAVRSGSRPITDR
jgi:hypothetical protein